MTDDVILKVDSLGKVFKVYQNPIGRVKEWVTFGKRIHHRKFVALQNISFEVRKGGFLGIIGPNGAGKSTLLKVITGVLDPTSGSYTVSGKVLSLLELNGGMDSDLTGRENIIRSAQLLGFPPRYLNDRMAQIEEFAELGEFFDQALSVYSSGMRIRLAFSMFAFLECDILILDEVLAVGDIFFRQKCYARLEKLVSQNVSIILVTHSTGTVRRYCDDVIVLEMGRVIFHGTADTAIQKYFEIKKDQGVKVSITDTYTEEDYVPPMRTQDKTTLEIQEWPAESAFLKNPLPQKCENKHAKLTHLLICDQQGRPVRAFKQGEKVYFYFAYHVKENIGVPVARINLLTVTNLLIHSKNSLQLKANHPLLVRAGETIRYKQMIKLDIAPGNYIFNLNLSAMRLSDFEQRDMLSAMDFKEKSIPVISIKPAGAIEVVRQSQNRAVDLHGGLCNLDGEIHVHVIHT